MPPTRTRLAASAAARPVRIATASRSGRSRSIRASRRSARRASGTIAAAAGSREPSARVPSKSDTMRSRPGRARIRSRSIWPGRARAAERVPAPATGRQGVTSTPGRMDRRPRTMASGPMPPAAPSRTIPSVSIQKWTGQGDGAPARGGLPVTVEAEREGRIQALGEPGDRALVLADVDRQDDEAGAPVARGEPVHQRELVLAGRAPGGHEVDPDGLAAAASRGRWSRRRPAARRGRRRLADVEAGIRAPAGAGAGDRRPGRGSGGRRRRADRRRARRHGRSMGRASGAAAGSGARARRPISRMAATPTPASSPAAIASRGPMAAEGTSTSDPGAAAVGRC